MIHTEVARILGTDSIQGEAREHWSTYPRFFASQKLRATSNASLSKAITELDHDTAEKGALMLYDYVLLIHLS